MDTIFLVKIDRLNVEPSVYYVMAELRVKPISKLSGKPLYDFAIMLFEDGLIGEFKHKKEVKYWWYGGKEKEDVFFQIYQQSFEATATVPEIYSYFEQKQKELQEKFTTILDQAYVSQKLAEKIISEKLDK